MSPDGKWVATGETDGREKNNRARRVTLWDMSNGRPVARIEIPGSTTIDGLHFRSDGKQLAVVASRRWQDRGSSRSRNWISLIDVQSQIIVGQLSTKQLDERTVNRIAHFDPVKGMLIECCYERQTGVIESDEEARAGGEELEPQWRRMQEAPLFLWRPEAKKLVRLYDKEEEFFPASEGRAFSLLDKRIRLIDPETGRVLAEWERPSRASFPECVSPDGKVLVAYRPRKVRQTDNSVREFCEVVLCEERKEPRVLVECRGSWEITHFSFSPDGRILLGVHDRPQMKAWAVGSGKLLWSSKKSLHKSLSCHLHANAKQIALFFHEDETPRLQLVDLQTGEIKAEKSGLRAAEVCWSFDGSQLVAIGESIQFLEAKTLTVKDPLPFQGHSCPVFANKANERWIACKGFAGIWVWDPSGNKCVLTPDRIKMQLIWGHVFLPGGDHIAIVGKVDNRARKECRLLVCRCSTGQIVHNILLEPLLPEIPASKQKEISTSVRAANFNSNGSRLAVAIGDEVQIWDTLLGKCIARRACQKLANARIEFAPGDRLIFLHDGQQVRYWDCTLSRQVVIPSRTDFPWGLFFSADGNRILYQNDDQILVWDVQQGRSIFACTFSGNPWRFRLSPAGDQLAVSVQDISVFEVPTNREQRMIRAYGHVNLQGVAWPQTMVELQNAFLARVEIAWTDFAVIDLESGRKITRVSSQFSMLALSPDGRILAHGDDDVTLVEFATGKEIGTIPGQQTGISSLAFSPDGRTLTTGGNDTTALVWDWASACRLRTKQPERVEDAWAKLSVRDARQAYAAMLSLAATPGDALALLRRELRPAGLDEFRRINEWITGLDDDSFAVRSRATRELAKSGRTARAAIEQALKRPQSAEAEGRLRTLLQTVEAGDLSLDELRQLRAIQILEWIKTPEARALLRDLAGGEALASSTHEAKAALERLGRLQQ